MSDIKNNEFTSVGNNQEVKNNPLANLDRVTNEATNKTNESRKAKESPEQLLPISIMHIVEGSSIAFSDPINLNGEVLGLPNPKLQLLEMHPSGSEDTGVSGLFLTADVAGNSTPLGYVVFTWSGDTTTHASMNINHLKRKKVQEQIQSVPQPLQESVAQSDLFEALKTNPDMRGKGLGKLLFLTGAARMRDLGFKEIEITGDLTIGKTVDTESFYTNMGAKVDLQTGHEIVTTETIVEQAGYLQQVFKQP